VQIDILLKKSEKSKSKNLVLFCFNWMRIRLHQGVQQLAVIGAASAEILGTRASNVVKFAARE